MNSMMDLRDALRLCLDKKIADNMRKIGSGQAKDYAEYKSSTGRVQGLNDARVLMDEVFAKQLNPGDDE